MTGAERRRALGACTIALVALSASSCTPSPPPPPQAPVQAATPETGALRIGVSAMLSAVATFEAYDTLFADLSRALGRPYRLVQRRTYQEMNALLLAGELDLAFLNTGAYAALGTRPPVDILLLPVVDGRTTHDSLIVVRAEASYTTFADLEGTRFAYTDPLSATGYALPISRILALHREPGSFFKSTLFSASHDRALLAVQDGVVDAAAVSSLGFYVTVVPGSSYWGKIRVLEKAGSVPNPPIVVPTKLPPELCDELQRYFLMLAETASGKAALRRLGVDRFILPPADLDYAPVRAMMEAAAAQAR